MLSKETVLIVGAGGSMPFKYPSGKVLVQEIVDGIRFARRGTQPEPLTELARQMLEAGCNFEMAQAFRAQLNESQCYSVDAFLEMHTEFIEVGKVAIAAALLPRETPQILFSQEDHWYRYLANRLGENISAGLNCPLTILTYNYDRSLEYYLYRALKTARALSNQQMAELTSRLRVIHLHGSLGKLPWQQATENSTIREYGNHESPITAARQIKIIHENVDDSAEYAEARNFLAQAGQIAFLGFGFHRTNIRRLRTEDWAHPVLDEKRIIGTCLGLTQAEELLATRDIKSRIHLTRADCHEFLRLNLDFIS